MRDSVAIIFSKNRPCQLDALLRSIQHYAPEVFARIYVIYKSSVGFTATYEGYNILRGRCSDRVRFIQEVELYRSFRSCLLLAFELAQDWNPSMVSFFSDDAILFRKVDPFFIPPGCLCHSLRLGKNLTYSYNANRPQREGECDFLWKFSNDGHFYYFKGMQAAVAQGPINKPGDLEDVFNAAPPLSGAVAYDTHSSLVCIQHNRVTTDAANRNEGGNAEDLNRRYVDDEEIDFLNMDFSSVNSPHMAIPYVFRKREKGR